MERPLVTELHKDIVHEHHKNIVEEKHRDVVHEHHQNIVHEHIQPVIQEEHVHEKHVPIIHESQKEIIHEKHIPIIHERHDRKVVEEFRAPIVHTETVSQPIVTRSREQAVVMTENVAPIVREEYSQSFQSTANLQRDFQQSLNLNEGRRQGETIIVEEQFRQGPQFQREELLLRDQNLGGLQQQQNFSSGQTVLIQEGSSMLNQGCNLSSGYGAERVLISEGQNLGGQSYLSSGTTYTTGG
jgi:hypothetical protein